MNRNITFTIIKPRAMSNGHAGEILSVISKAGFWIAGMKMIQLSQKQAEQFYSVHRERPFYADLVNFMISGPIVVAVLEKDDAVASYRKLIGATDPSKAEEGTIRKMFAESIEANAVHGSDSDENAIIESGFFFSQSDLFDRNGAFLNQTAGE